MKAGVAGQIADAVVLHIHPVNIPIGIRQDALGQVMADEAVNSEDQDSFHCGKESKI